MFIKQRVDRIHSTLSSDLDSLFGTILVSLTSGKVSELDKAKWMSDLNECLRTYDVLGLWRDAEDVLRREVVRNFVKRVSIISVNALLDSHAFYQTVFSGALAAPHSPLMPHTPFRASSGSSYLSSNTLLPPKTPYTPFTAITARQSLYTPGKNENPYSNILEESDDSLAKLFTQILRFVERDLLRIMEMAEKVAIKAVKVGTPTTASAPVASPDKGFNIMANVIWEEFGRAIMDDLGGVVFSAGKPDEFRKVKKTNYSNCKTLNLFSL
jgi:conserved oligomeric Golgi complex subunit 2